MIRISSSVLIPLVSLAILAGAMVMGGRRATDAQGRPTVVYAHPPCPPDLMRHYNLAFDRFRQEHPDIDLQVLHVTGNYEDKIKVMFAGKVAPDVIFMYPTALTAWVELDALRPLDDLLTANGKTQAGDYFPAAVETFSSRGRIYGLPKDASADLLFFNPEMFRRDGLDLPSPDWTWQDLLHAAQRLTQDTDGDGRTDIYGLQQPDWVLMVFQNGGQILNEDATRCVLDSPEAVEALEFWVALRQTHGVSPTFEMTVDTSSWRLFALQRTAMMISMYPGVQILRRTCDFDWDIAIVPRGPRRACAKFTGSALAVTTQSRHPEAAFEWARWMTCEGMRHVMAFELPSYKPLGGSAAWLDSPEPPPSKQVAVDTMSIAVPPVKHAAYAEILDAITPSLDSANRGECSVKEAVGIIVPKVNAILARRPAQDQQR